MALVRRKNDVVSLAELTNFSRESLIGRLAGWKREVAEKSNETPLIRLVLALENCLHSARFNAVIAKIPFDEKTLFNNRHLIKATLGETVMVYSAERLAKKLADDYLTYAHLDVKNIAKQEGWAAPLNEYLTSAALSQAQYMVHAQATYTIPPHRKNTEQHIETYLTHCRQQAETGAIKVVLGQEIINSLKAHRVRLGDKIGHVAVRRSDERTLEENAQRKTDNDALIAYLSQTVSPSLLAVRTNNVFTSSFIKN